MQIAIENTLPFSSFMAHAKRIFAEVQTQGPKLITEEGHPSCVILSHTEYERIMEELADATVVRMAEERLAKPRAAEDWKRSRSDDGMENNLLAGSERGFAQAGREHKANGTKGDS